MQAANSASRQRQVELHALQVGPAVRFAVEDAVVGLVDDGIVVGPQPRFGKGASTVHGGGMSRAPKVRAAG